MEALIAVLAVAALLQAPATCDSIVAAAKVDSVPAGIFISARRVDRQAAAGQESHVALNVGAAFTPPRPLKLSVFGAAPVLRALRATGGDKSPQLRAPAITGVYEVVTSSSDTTPGVRVLRASLIAGFDSSAISAIREAALIPDVFRTLAGEDSLRVDVRFSTDSVAGARRLYSGYFPRMPIVDATPDEANAPLVFPPEARGDSLVSGTVVLRFIVGRDGLPEPGTVEAVRATHLSFLRAALVALVSQRFHPATIRGCPVAQVIDYPMSFVAPEPPVS